MSLRSVPLQVVQRELEPRVQELVQLGQEVWVLERPASSQLAVALVEPAILRAMGQDTP